MMAATAIFTTIHAKNHTRTHANTQIPVQMHFDQNEKNAKNNENGHKTCISYDERMVGNVRQKSASESETKVAMEYLTCNVHGEYRACLICLGHFSLYVDSCFIDFSNSHIHSHIVFIVGRTWHGCADFPMSDVCVRRLSTIQRFMQIFTIYDQPYPFS